MKLGSTWKIEYLEFGATRRRREDELGFVVTGICLKGKELYFSFFSFEATLILPIRVETLEVWGFEELRRLSKSEKPEELR